jgi:hypothetical protein
MISNKSGIVACNEKFKPYKKQRYFKLKPIQAIIKGKGLVNSNCFNRTTYTKDSDIQI